MGKVDAAAAEDSAALRSWLEGIGRSAAAWKNHKKEGQNKKRNNLKGTRCKLTTATPRIFDLFTAHRNGNGRAGRGAQASNNWVAGGGLTETKFPFLCNDPHLALMAPSIWSVSELTVRESNPYGHLTN